MQNGIRQQYLQAMGVDVWIRRSITIEEAAAQEESQIYELDEPRVTPAYGIGAASAPSNESTSTISREIFQQNAIALTGWLGTQCLMPVQIGDVSVTSVGNKDAQLLILSDCSVSDRRTHQPFFGRAAFLLQAMLRSIGESFESVLQAELDAPRSQAKTLVSLLEDESVKAILLLVDLPADKSADYLSDLRGQICDEHLSGARIFISYHPDFLIKHPQTKALAWEDLKQVRDYLASQ